MMKRKAAFAAAVILLTAVSGCSKSGGSNAPYENTATSDSSAYENESLSEQDMTPDEISLDLSQSGKPAVSEVCVSGVFGGGSLTDIYGAEGGDKRFTEEEGLFSCPIRFESGDFHAGVISFRYVPERLFGTPPENLKIMYCSGESGSMEYAASVLDGESCEVSAPAEGAGVYILVDDYARRISLGQDVSGLTVPQAHDTLYDGEIPYYSESRPFTVVIPDGCYGYEEIGDIDADGFDYHTFYHIVCTHTAFVWADISYITPDSRMSLAEFEKIIKEQLPYLSRGGEIPSRTVDSCSRIKSADGTEGIRAECDDVYAPSGINPKLTFRTVCCYFPDSDGGFYEVRAQFMKSPYDPDGLTDKASEKILSSFALKDR